jgi:hypothetical protein
LRYFPYENEHRIFKPVEITIEGNQGRKETNRRDGLIWVIIHIYMEMTQRNSLYSYLKQIKMAFSKKREQEDKISPFWEVGTSGRRMI